MIESQLRRRILGSAVLASRVIAQQNILPRERAAFKRYVDILREPNHRRGMDREFLRVQDVAIVLFDSGHSFKDHHHCAPLGAHVDGLKRSIQD